MKVEVLRPKARVVLDILDVVSLLLAKDGKQLFIEDSRDHRVFQNLDVDDSFLVSQCDVRH